MQIKTTTRYCLKPVRIVIIKEKNKKQITSVGKDVQKKEPLCTVAGNANGAATMGNSMAGLQKIENRTAI